jgi:hypothetical protein
MFIIQYVKEFRFAARFDKPLPGSVDPHAYKYHFIGLGKNLDGPELR